MFMGGWVFQLSHQLVYEKEKLEEERRKHMMAKQHWEQTKEALVLELSEVRKGSGYESEESQVDYRVDRMNGSNNHWGKVGCLVTN